MAYMARLIVYDFPGEQEALDVQIGRSLPDGTKQLPNGDIRVVTIPNSMCRLLGLLCERALEEVDNEPSN